MVKNMRFIQLFIFVIFILASSTQASAVDLPVRIVNETGYDLVIVDVFANDKRGRDARQGSCHMQERSGAGAMSGAIVRTNDDLRCELRGTQKKQRSLEVRVRCGFTQPFNAEQMVVFPRERGWFGRKHLKNNNDIYTLKIKESDC